VITTAASGDVTVTVDDTTPFSVGDEVLVWVVQGVDAGTRAFHFVSAVGSASLTLEPPLLDDLDLADTIIVQRVPHHTTVSVTGDLLPAAWTGVDGGAVVFRATGTVTIGAAVDASALGYLGGDAAEGNNYVPNTTGGSYSTGPAAASASATRNGGGGGAHTGTSAIPIGGAGGGYGSIGDDAASRLTTYNFSNGSTYGDSALSEWFLGSGGGGGAPDLGSDGLSHNNISGTGGAGGGLVAIYSADSIDLTGSINADGADGGDADCVGSSSSCTTPGETGGGGGGSGGQILLVAPDITITGSVEALGGLGGYSYSDVYVSRAAGDGGNGRIRLEYTTLSGLSNVDPTPSTGTYTD
jgi:hypothetical protein